MYFFQFFPIYVAYNRLLSSLFLSTREAACFIISLVDSVCMCVSMSVFLSDDNFRKPRRREFIPAQCTPDIATANMDQVCIWRSSGQRQGYRSQKVENFYSRNAKNSIAHNSGSIKHRTIRFACSMRFTATSDGVCDRHLCHVTGSDHV